MAEKQNPFQRIRLVYRQTPTLLKCLLVGMLLVGTLALMVLRFSLKEAEAKTEQLRQEAIALEQENAELKRSISILGTVQSVTELAADMLDLVDPNTVYYEPK